MKDPFNLFIEDSVYYSSQRYYKLMFETKRLFFECLNDKKEASYFNKKIKEIWGNVDHSYMEQRIKELEEMVSAKNIDGREIVNPNAVFKQIFELEPESRFIEVEKKFEEVMEKYYKGRLKTVNNGIVDKQTYLTELVKKYENTQAIIPYFNKDGTVRCYHNIASYNSMLYNTNLNRAGWNRTMYDSQLLDNDLVYLPAHPFACPLCMQWQGRVYSVSGKSLKYPPKDLAIDGGVGHPNCKHQWTIYWGDDQLQKNVYNSAEWEEAYKNKQKIRSLELERSKIKNDKKIYENIGSFEEIDKANERIRLLNAKIKELNKNG